MSEVQQRLPPTPRGRGSSRGGRGGSSFGSRGGAAARPNRNSNGDINLSYSTEDHSEVGQLKKQYAPELEKLKDMFPGWSAEDLLTVLQESSGDVEVTANKIYDGPCSISSFFSMFTVFFGLTRCFTILSCHFVATELNLVHVL